MDKNYRIKEDQKNNQTEPTIRRKSNSINKISLRSKLEYTKHLQHKNLINIQKLFSKEKSALNQGSTPKFYAFNLNISKNNSIKLRQNGHSFIYPMQENYQKEKIISEIFRIEEEINQKNEELDEYKDFYKKLQEHNLTFKAIIEGILNIEEDSPLDNDKNKENTIEEKSKIKLKPTKINRLKLQIKNYDKSIEEKEKLLDKAKNKKSINNFIIINKMINHKNRELESLVFGGQKLQYSKHEMDIKIDFYFDSIKSYRENHNKLQDKLKINEKEINYNRKEIKQIEKEIDDYYLKIDKLEEELKIIEENNNKKKEEIEILNKEYNNKRKLQKEKELIYKDIDNIDSKIYSIKKIIERNDRNIMRIKYENEEFQNDISILKVESDRLNERAKQCQKNKNNSIKYEKEIQQMKKEINKNKLKYDEMIKKEKEDKEKIRKEIEDFENAKIGLINKINELTKELKEKTKENGNKEEELTKANEEYNILIKDKNSHN